ncbi:phage tail length tape measure family protein [Deefgea piscis]|uniref:phage tail length tape measure family protein n=1 Tax=Deefgea piscis TaxID=2739061 RepID=UPI001C7E7C06|nr:phage tail length tape measure family protein [Deefgea piscis]QZA80864.1 phage tail length tape measure family protein [Deefgea piscis]
MEELGVKVKVDGSSVPAETAKVNQSLQSVGAEAEKYLKTLWAEYQQLGKTSGEIAAYTAKQQGLSTEVQRQAKLIGDKIDLYHREEEAAKQLAKMQDDAARREIRAIADKTAAQERYLNALAHQNATTGLSWGDKKRLDADQMGLNPTQLALAKQHITEIENKITAMGAAAVKNGAVTADAVRSVGVSAGQTSNAMRQLPAQMTDIATQLAGGQNPLLILVQQGGQIKDSFGGIGPAIEGITSAINPMSLAIGTTAVTVGAFAYAFYSGSQEVQAFNKAIAMTGNITGVTSNQLTDMSRRVGDTIGTQAAAADALAQIAGSGKVAAASMEHYAEVAVRANKATGKEISETVKEFALLADAPVAGSIKLNESYHHLTASVLDQIAALEKQGKAQEAVKLAQDTYADASERMSKQVIENVGSIERAWSSLKGTVAGVWNDMLNVGRKSTPAEELARLQKQLAITQSLLNSSAAGRTADYGNRAIEDRSTAQRSELLAREKHQQTEISNRQELLRLEAKQSAIQLEQGQIREAGVKAYSAIATAQDQNLSKQVQLNTALKNYRTQLDALRKSDPNSSRLAPDAIARGESAIRERFKETPSPRKSNGAITLPTDNELASLKAKIDAVKEELAWGTKLNEGEKEALKIQQQLSFVSDNKIRQKLQLKLLSAEEYGDLLKVASAAKEYADATKKQDDANQRELEQLKQQTLSWQNKVQFYGMGEAALDGYTLAQLNATIAEKEALATRIQDTGELAKEIKYLKEKAAILGGKVGAQTEFDGLEAADKAAKDFAAARKQEADDLQGLYRGVFQSMEDSMVSFATGGGMSFKGMIDSMIQDLIRYQIRQSLIKPLMEVIGGGGGGGGGLGGLLGLGMSMIGSMFGGSGYGTFGTQTAAPSFTNIGNLGGFVPSASRGFDIPSGVNPLTQLHEEEVVLPAYIANPMRDMFKNGGTQSSSQAVSVVISPQIDARGADAGAVERIEAALARLANSVPEMATNAVRGAMTRARQTPNF